MASPALPLWKNITDFHEKLIDRIESDAAELGMC